MNILLNYFNNDLFGYMKRKQVKNNASDICKS